MKRIIAMCLLLLASMPPALAKVAIGEPAPDFTLPDSNGKTQTLSQFKGKTVVLEWHGTACPYVAKHYGSGNMQKQQQEAAAAGVIWLTVNSSFSRPMGELDAAGANAYMAKRGAQPAAYLMDPQGTVGHLYGARTTPNMFVIDANGVLRYMGAIDSINSTDQADIAKATQYVPQVLAELKAGKPVSVPVTDPYGCSVKYGS